MKKVILALCFAVSMVLVLAGCGSGTKVESLNTEGFKSAMSDGNTVIVDTRQPGFRVPRL